MEQHSSATALFIVLVVIIVGSVGYYFVQISDTSPIDQQPPTTTVPQPMATPVRPAGTQATQDTPTTPATTTPQMLSTASTTIHDVATTTTDVTDQPAYLIAAYTKNGKNYIDVDYVELLGGPEAITAKVEDGECLNAQDCYNYPNGYKRNRNPLVRTFEVSPTATIIVNGATAATINELDKTNLGDPYGLDLSISFSKLSTAITAMRSYTTVKPSFKTPKTFVMITVKNTVVTNIMEPYQE